MGSPWGWMRRFCRQTWVLFRKEAGVMEDRKTVAATGLGKRCREVLRKQERWRKDEEKGDGVKKVRKWLFYPQHRALVVCLIHALQ